MTGSIICFALVLVVFLDFIQFAILKKIISIRLGIVRSERVKSIYKLSFCQRVF